MTQSSRGAQAAAARGLKAHYAFQFTADCKTADVAQPQVERTGYATRLNRAREQAPVAQFLGALDEGRGGRSRNAGRVLHGLHAKDCFSIRGRRIEAAQKLGLGRDTITRKIRRTRSRVRRSGRQLREQMLAHPG